MSVTAIYVMAGGGLQNSQINSGQWLPLSNVNMSVIYVVMWLNSWLKTPTTWSEGIMAQVLDMDQADKLGGGISTNAIMGNR